MKVIIDDKEISVVRCKQVGNALFIEPLDEEELLSSGSSEYNHVAIKWTNPGNWEVIFRAGGETVSEY